MKKAFTAATLATMLLYWGASPAFAHYIASGWIQSYTSSDICVNEYTQLSHSSTYPGGHFIGSVSSWTNFVHNCVAKKWTNVAIRIEGWRWSSVRNRWELCVPTVQPPPDTNDYFYTYSYQYQYRFNFRTAPCGAGYYTDDSTGWAQNGNTWYGGWVIDLFDYRGGGTEWYHHLPES